MTRRIFYGWWVVLACFCIGLYGTGAVFFGFTAFFEPLVREFGWSHTQVSLAVSLRAWGLGIFGPLIGFLVDRFGPRKLIFCGTFAVGAGLALLGTTHSLAMFYGFFLLASLGAIGSAGVILSAAVGNWFREDLGKALGIVTCGPGASGFLVPFIVVLIDLYGWRTTFIILGLGMWILGIPLASVIRDRPEQIGHLVGAEIRQDSTPSVRNRHEAVERSLKDVIRQRAFLYLMFAEAVRMMTTSAVVLHIMPYLSHMGMNRSAAGMAAAAIPVVSMVGVFGFGWFGDIFEKRRLLALTLGLMGAGMLAFSYVQQKWCILIFLGLFPPGYGGGMVLVRTIQRDYIGMNSFGKMLGMILAAGAVGEIIGPPLAGWIFDTMGSYRLIWMVLCVFNVLALWLVIRSQPLFPKQRT